VYLHVFLTSTLEEGGQPNVTTIRRGGGGCWNGGFGEEISLLPLLGIKPRFLGHPARNLVTVMSELSQRSITLNMW
jgi:hypothetical protein